jgi:hypothetical protein
MGSPDTPLHANAFAGFATRKNILAVAEFFETQLPSFRLGAIILFKTAAADGLGLVSTLAKVLQERIRGRWVFTGASISLRRDSSSIQLLPHLKIICLRCIYDKRQRHRTKATEKFVLANNLPRGVFVEPTVLQAAEGGCGQLGSILAASG